MSTTVSVFGDDALQTDDAVALADRMERREVSSAELVEAAIARARELDAQCNAIVVEDYDRARRAAEAPRSGGIAGVPTFIKDTDDVEGLPTAMGSRAVPAHSAKRDSGFVRQLKSVGLVCIGKSTLPEFGLTGTTEPLLTGPTRNPWNTEHTTGGSSGGACALVAAGVVPIAHANDGAGSIRIPASCCGLIGLKPTQGRLARIEGSELLPVNIVHQGVVTRTVRDTATFYAEVEKRHGSGRLPPIGKVEGPGKKRLRIALLTASHHGPSDPDCVAAATRAAQLCEQMGHGVEEIDLPVVGRFEEDFFAYWAMMTFAILKIERLKFGRRFDRDRVEPLTRALEERFRSRWRGIFSAIRRLRSFRHLYSDLLGRYDVLLTPTLGQAPPKLGYLSTTLDFETCISRVKSFIPFTPVQNVAGAPAISVPVARNCDNLPIGVQLAGAVGDDRTILELAFALEAAVDWRHLGALRK